MIVDRIPGGETQMFKPVIPVIRTSPGSDVARISADLPGPRTSKQSRTGGTVLQPLLLRRPTQMWT
jgi:hypothetical protein